MILAPGHKVKFKVFAHRNQSCSLWFFTVETNKAEPQKKEIEQCL